MGRQKATSLLFLPSSLPRIGFCSWLAHSKGTDGKGSQKGKGERERRKMKKKNNIKINNRRSKEEEMDANKREWDFKTIIKDVQSFSASHMTWKERKELENRKVVSLGGKPVKKQRLPLSVARVQMKRQKEREQKIREENELLGRFRGRFGDIGAKRSAGKRLPEDRVLKSTEGHFKNGVLDVKHLLRSAAPSRDNSSSAHVVNDRKKKKKNKGSGKKNKGKNKGGGRKHH